MCVELETLKFQRLNSARKKQFGRCALGEENAWEYVGKIHAGQGFLRTLVCKYTFWRTDSRTGAQAQPDGRTGSVGRAHRLSRTVKGSAVSPRTQRLEPKQAHRTGARVKDQSTPSRRAGQLVRAGERSNAWIYVGTLLCAQTPFHT